MFGKRYAGITVCVVACLMALTSPLVCSDDTDSSVIEETQKLLPSELEIARSFGSAVAIQGAAAFVGDEADSLATGAVHVFHRNESGLFRQTGRLTAFDGESGDYFGHSLAIDQDTILIGAPAFRYNRGAVYVFGRTASGAWMQTQKLLPSNVPQNATRNLFGIDVDIDGDTAIIGTGIDLDDVYIFRKGIGGIWHEEARLQKPYPEQVDAVAVFGDTVLCKGRYYAGGPESFDAVYVYRTNQPGQWTLIETIVTPTFPDYSFTNFGEDVDLQQGIAVITATHDDDAGDNSGAVFFYREFPDGSWRQTQKLTSPDRQDYDYFGGNVSMDGNSLVVSASANTDVTGKAYAFRKMRNGQWQEVAQLLSSDRARNDDYGESVVVHGTTVLVGAPDWADVGSAYSFTVAGLAARKEILIDFKPGNRRNVVNPRSKGRFWVAVLSDSEFDALQADPTTVAFGQGEASPDGYRVKDVNRDRLPDLMLRFRTPEVGLQCGDTEVELTGETYAGDSVIGTDKVKTVGCKKKPKKGKKK